MDKLPEEVVRSILDYAMIRDEPFNLEEVLIGRAKMREQPFLRSYPYDEGIHLERIPRTLWSTQGRTQKPHLQDWEMVVGTCQRFRRLGKESFFSHKVFAMDPRLPFEFQRLEISCLSREEQQVSTSQTPTLSIPHVRLPYAMEGWLPHLCYPKEKLTLVFHFRLL